ncbi:magnesium chelatase domain-containing protein, partial [Thermodesulfobacteriota bacterium]
ALMIAVIEKKLGIPLGDQDIFLNAVGGVRATEPASDLAVASALLSSFMDRAVPPQTVIFGEVGLAGEVRRVSRAEARIGEAARLGFKLIVVPSSNFDPSLQSKGLSIRGISHIGELTQILFEG